MIGNVAHISGRQQAAIGEAVKHNQIKLAQLHLEQLTHRKGDQRQFIERRQIILLRRAQNGEMHQIHIRIGLQQAPPGAFAGMRLTGNQQHAQPIPHTIYRDHLAVIERAYLARARLCLQLNHHRATARHWHGNGVLSPDGDFLTPRSTAIAADNQPGIATSRRAQILNHHAQFNLLADNAKARGRDQTQAPINLPRAARQQHMKGRIKGQQRRRVMHLAIRQRDHARKPRPRHIRQGRPQSRKQRRATLASFGHLYHPQIKRGQTHSPRFQGSARRCDALSPISNLRAVTTVNGQDGYIGAGFAFLAQQARIAERPQQDHHRQRTPPNAAGTLIKAIGQKDQGKGREKRKQPKREAREKIQIGQVLSHEISGALPPSPCRGAGWPKPALRAGLVWRLRAEPRRVTPDPAETGTRLGCGAADQAPCWVGIGQVTLEGPDIGQFRHRFRTGNYRTITRLHQIDLIRYQAHGDFGNTATQLSGFNPAFLDIAQFSALRLTCSLTRGNRLIETGISLLRQKGLQGGAITTGKGLHNHAKGCFRPIQKTVRIKTAVPLLDLHQRLTHWAARIRNDTPRTALGRLGANLDLGRGATRSRHRRGFGLSLTLKPRPAAKHAPQPQHQKGRNHREENQIYRQATHVFAPWHLI